MFRSSLLSSFLITAVAVFALQTAAAAQACGNTAEGDVVIMIDISGSMSADGIAAQKNAATELLNFFNGAQVKPRVAIGRFNTVCFSPAECYPNPPSPHSSMITPLSLNYANAYAALGSGAGSILGQGPGGDGNGGANIAHALELAQSHIVDSGSPATPNYIVLISDGDPTFPGYYTDLSCGNCFCQQAEDAARQSATAIKSSQTKIFTVHIGATNCYGASLMSQLSSGLGFAFTGGQSLEGIFEEISTTIVCDDSQSCTSDSCNQSAGQCEFIELDLNQNGFGDCNEPTPTPGPTPPPADCNQIDITGYKSALNTIITNQDQQLSRLLRELRVRRLQCKNPLKIQKFVKNAAKLLDPTLAQNSLQVDGLPFIVLACDGVLGCSSAAVPLNVSSYSSNSSTVRDLTLQAIKLRTTCFGGACEGEVKDCKRRVQIRRKQTRKERRLAIDLHNGNGTNLSSIPTTTFQCQ